MFSKLMIFYTVLWLVSLSAQQASKVKQERLKNIKVSGLKCNKANTHREIADLISQQLGINDIQLGEYSCRVLRPKAPDNNKTNFPQLSHPSGQAGGITPEDPSPPEALLIIVSFDNIWRRREVYGRKKFLKGTDIFFSEDLPKLESNLLFQCRGNKESRLTSWC